MNKDVLNRHLQKVRDIKSELKRRSTSSVLDRADRLPADTELLNKIALSYFLLLADFRQSVFHIIAFCGRIDSLLFPYDAALASVEIRIIRFSAVINGYMVIVSEKL